MTFLKALTDIVFKEEIRQMSYRLTTGFLDLTIRPGSVPNLFKVAERQNPKRAFLFVSTVLGRHIPVKPNQHRAILNFLAQRVAENLHDSGPVLVMGYAETAVGLGAGVFDSLCRITGRNDIGYLQTTRHPVSDTPVWFSIEETHSHATTHFIHKPRDVMFTSDKKTTLVLVDDEATTGKTLKTLAEGLKSAGLAFDRVVLVTLTDWSGGLSEYTIKASMPNLDVRTVSLMKGSYLWINDENVERIALPGAISVSTPKWSPEPHPASLRLGVTSDNRAQIKAALPDLADHCAEGDRVLVIGTGEYVWHPFLASETLTSHGYNVDFCATTRSPINLGASITNKFVFEDHFGIGVEMYLHNVDPSDYDRIFIFTETSSKGICEKLRKALPGASIFSYGSTSPITLEEPGL